MAYRTFLNIGGEQRQLLGFNTHYFQMNNFTICKWSEQHSFGTLHELEALSRLNVQAFRPVGEVFGGVFRISFESTDNDDLFYYWFKSVQAMHGTIEMYNGREPDIPMRRIEFWDAWLSHISEEFSSTDNRPMTLHCIISPATVRYNKEVVFRKNWWMTDISPNSEQEKEMHEPFVKRIFWKGREQGQERKDIMLNHDIKLQIELSDYRQGDTVELTVKQSNGRRIKSSSTEFSVSGTADENGLVIIENFKVECDFKDDNQNFGMIEFYHKDRRVGEFKENFGWTYIKEGGVTKVFVNIELNGNFVPKGCLITDLKEAINGCYQRTLENASGGTVTGKLFFTGVKTEELP